MISTALQTAQKAARVKQYKLNHLKTEMNNRSKNTNSKNRLIMYYNNKLLYNDNSHNVYVAENENQLKTETGTKTTLSTCVNNVSMNQVKMVYGDVYKRYWTYGGEIYGVKPGRVDRLENGPDNIADTNLYDIKGYDMVYSTISTNSDATNISWFALPKPNLWLKCMRIYHDINWETE